MAIKNLQDLLILHRYLIKGEVQEAAAPYYAAYLASKFGVVVNSPLLLCEDNVRAIADLFCREVPDSFYANPQDTSFYSEQELYIEQLISYLKIEMCGVESEDPAVFARLPVFDKVLPTYVQGEEKVIRTFYIIDREEAEHYVSKLFEGYCSYTRPWSTSERGEVIFCIDNGYFYGQNIACKDNIIFLLKTYGSEEFAKMLDYKDVVKISLSILEVRKQLTIDEKTRALLALAVKNARPCVLSKKQSKYFNQLIKKTGADIPLTDNSDSPYAIAKKLVADGDVVGAAKFLATQGSLLLRSLFWLLSRAESDEEVDEILSLLKIGKPIVGMQVLYMLTGYTDALRRFVFYKKGIKIMHEESEEESEKRRSRVELSVRKKVEAAVISEIKRYYASRPSLGRIYVSDSFRKVGVPINTAVCGNGLDVLPPGSRLPISGDYLRAFCYWNGVHDMDLSVVFYDGDTMTIALSWSTYNFKPFGDSALTSGDARDKDGAEYIDFRIKELLEKGWKYGVVFVNAFGGMFNEGEVFCGYQNKDDLKTKAWAPDNIAMKMSVKGEGRQFAAFALDLQRREVVVLNTLIGTHGYVVDKDSVYAFKPYLTPDVLDAFNMYTLLSLRGDLVDDPADADIVFDPDYVGKDGQKIVRPWDVPLLVSFVN